MSESTFELKYLSREAGRGRLQAQSGRVITPSVTSCFAWMRFKMEPKFELEEVDKKRNFPQILLPIYFALLILLS